MYKAYTIILLVLCPTVPLIVTPEAGIASVRFESDTGPYLESFLRHNLKSNQGSIGAGVGSQRAVLQFKDSLTPRETAFAEDLGIQFRRRNQQPIRVGSTYLCDVPTIDALERLSAIGLKRATSGEKKFYPSLETSVPTMNTPSVWNNLEKEGTRIDGSGVTVAVIDTGASWLHPTFWRATKNNINVIENNGEFYADLDDDSIADNNEGPLKQTEEQSTGTIEVSNEYLFIDVGDDDQFSYAAGDRWVAGIDANDDGILTLPTENVALLGESKVKMFYDQGESEVFVRDVNLTSSVLPGGDDNGHGTHVASTIAGGQIGLTSMVGVAPGVDLIVIKSPLTSASIIDGIHFATAHDADVINMSFSSYLGFLDGTDLEDLAATDAFLQNDTLCVAAAGNLGGRSKHSRFSVPTGDDAGTTLSVSNPPDYSFLNVIWYSSNQDESVTLSPPDGGEDVTLGPIGEMVGSAYSVTTSDINAYAFVDVSSRGFNRLIIQVSESEHNWTSGVWTVTVENPSGEEITVDAYAWDNAWSGGSLRFTSRIDNSHTISCPATADFAVAVSSYSEATERISPTSSNGPRIDGNIKPELSAPGASIEAASRFTSISTSLWISRTGTSMATPHVAGALALSYQSSQSSSAWDDLSALFEGAGGFDAHNSLPTNDAGFGLCDSLHTVRHVLDVPLENGTSLSDWAGIPPLVNGHENITQDGKLDILSFSAYHDENQIGAAITVRNAPSWESFNLSLELNLDNNEGTGYQGIDSVVNMTMGSLQLYHWNEGWVEAAENEADWWNSSATIFIRVNADSVADSFSINTYTYNSTDSTVDFLQDMTLENMWRPLFKNIEFGITAGTYSLNISIKDRDTQSESINLGWRLVFGQDSILQTDTASGSKNYFLTFNSTSWDTTYVVSALLNVSDGYDTLHLNSLMLERTASGVLEISSASLDSNTARVGPFVQDMITGRIVVEGYLKASEVGISFAGGTSNPLNFSLSGTEGVYEIRVRPSGLSPGEYSVHAYAISRTGQRIEERFATLDVIQDYTILIIGAVAVGGMLAILMLASRYFRKDGE